jgi:spore maturation protein CgeB
MGKNFPSSAPIGVIAYSDFYDQPEQKVWGDYWFKENLVKEFVRSGYPVDNSSPKILLHLFGEPLEDLPSDTYKILWIHSHPDRISPEVLEKYQKIYCISRPFTRKIIDMGFDADFLMIPTNMTPARCEKKYDIVFVGNTRQNKMRQVINDLGDPTYQVKIWGWGWKGLIPDAWYGGEYYENERLNELYAASRIVLNDHHDDMKREGFINPRLLDVLASGGFVVSDDVPGMNNFLDCSVPTYHSAGELRSLLNVYMSDDAARERLAEKGRKIASQYTYAACCSEIIRHISTISGKLFL